MDLAEYFENRRGFGVFSTADRRGVVNAAVYGRPHVLENGELVFVMRNRLSLNNLRENPYAHYLFHEQAEGYEGVRLKLELIRYVQDKTLYDKYSRSRRDKSQDSEQSYVAFFRMTSYLPLIGT